MNLSKFLGFAWLVFCVSAYANSTQKTKQESEQNIINPSFDCKKARTLDKEMAQAYKKARVSLCALRDEMDKKHKIKLEAVNDALLNDFINKYEQEY